MSTTPITLLNYVAVPVGAAEYYAFRFRGDSRRASSFEESRLPWLFAGDSSDQAERQWRNVDDETKMAADLVDAMT